MFSAAAIALDPIRMNADERLSELADLLALVRFRARQSSGLSEFSEDSSLDFSRQESGHVLPKRVRSTYTVVSDRVLARVAALKTTPTPALKARWRELFGREAPPFNRKYIESRLAYRIQELAYGGLKPETVKRSACASLGSSSTAAISRSGAPGSTTVRSPGRG